MDKLQLLEEFKQAADSGLIKKSEVDSLFGESQENNLVVGGFKKIGISDVLYYLGGGIVFLGIAILIFQNWDSLGIVAKVLVTLGSGIAAYFVGALFSRDERTSTVGLAFYFVSGLIMPVGVGVVFHISGLDTGTAQVQSYIWGIVFLAFFVSYHALKKDVFLLFSILYATVLFFSLTSWLAYSSAYFSDWKFVSYQFLVAGLAYILFGYYFNQHQKTGFTAFLYSFGLIGFLGAALSLGSWSPNQNAFWEIIFPGLVFAVIFLSVYLKSKAFLVFGTLFLMGYIFKITAEYFSDGLGWPLALVIAGLLMIAVGYGAVYLRKKYMMQ